MVIVCYNNNCIINQTVFHACFTVAYFVLYFDSFWKHLIFILNCACYYGIEVLGLVHIYRQSLSLSKNKQLW